MVAVVMLCAGVAPGARAGGETQRLAVELAYICGFPAEERGGREGRDGKRRVVEEHPVGVRISGTLPGAGRAGEAIRLGEPAVVVALPDAARAASGVLRAASVTGEARLALAVAQGEHRAEAVWSGRAAPTPAQGPGAQSPGPGPGAASDSGGTASDQGSGSGAASGQGSRTAAGAAPGSATPSGPGAPAPTPDSAPDSTPSSTPAPDVPSGGLTLAFEGEASAVTPGDGGDLTLDAAALALELAAHTAEGEPVEPPRRLTLGCAPAAGQRTLLATIPVPNPGPGTESPAPGASPSPTASAATAPQRPGPGRDPERGPSGRKGRAGTVPPCVGDTENPFAMVAYVTGYANVAKLDGASGIPLSCTQLIDVSKKIVLKPDGLHLLQHATGRLDHEGRPLIPPARATFLTFGFMPTTATMELTQLDTMTIDSDILLAKYTGTTLIRLPLSLRLYDVEVNGVPLDVGPRCRTAGPLHSTDPDPAQNTGDHVVLTGELRGPNDGYQLVTGGVLTSTVTIPPFTGCGVDEDLDALFTASVSGPGNYLKQVQGAPCASGNPRPDPTYCTADHQPVKVPRPER